MSDSENVIRCPQCGHDNRAKDHFCSNCGSRLLRAPQPPTAEPESETTPEPEPTPVFGTTETTRPPIQSTFSSFPPPVTPGFVQNQGTSNTSNDDTEWKMSSLGPPPKSKRRIWLWIVIGILAFCLLVCVGMAIFLNTGTGQDWINDLGTQVSEEATKAAN